MADIKANLGVGLSGSFRVVKTKRTGEKTLDLSFNNLVLDVGWDNLVAAKIAGKARAISSEYWLPKYLFLGTGTTEPDPADTGLESVSGTLAGKLGSYEMSRDYLNKTSDVNYTFSYGEGEAEGVWTELGLAFDSDYSTPYNRSLFRDENGNPISVTVLSDEYLMVYVTIRAHFNEITSSGSFTYNGSSVGYTVDWAKDGIEGWWRRGFGGDGVWQGYFKEYESSGNLPESFTYYAQTNASHVGPGMYFESPSYEAGPVNGSVTLGGFTFFTDSPYFQNPYEFLAVIFDSPITIPDDHKITFGINSFTISRGTVPSS